MEMREKRTVQPGPSLECSKSGRRSASFVIRISVCWGRWADLPTQPQVLGSGSKARVLEVACASGERVTVPRANVELIAE